MLKATGIVSLAAILLGGCALFGGPADRALRRTPSFREGYSDGCAAATGKSANPRETTSLAGTDNIYRRGYANGLQTCRATAISPGSAPYKPLTGGVPTSNAN